MRTLIHACTFIETAEQRDLLLVWLALTEKLNPSTPILLVDSNGGIDPVSFLPGNEITTTHDPLAFHRRTWKRYQLPDNDDIPTLDPNATHHIVYFDGPPLGHPAKGGEQDGPGRAGCKCIEIAAASGFDRAAHIEADILLAKPVASIFAQMTKPTACAGRVKGHQFLENGLFFYDPQFLANTKFVEKYNWRGPLRPFAEAKYESILGPDLQVLPLTGCRFDDTSVENWRQLYPNGADFCTHAPQPVLHEHLYQHDMDTLWAEATGIAPSLERLAG